MKIVVAGDYCPRIASSEIDRLGRIEEDLSAVTPILQSVDFSIVNLEAPVPDAQCEPIAKVGESLSVEEDDIIALKTIGFTAVTLANNHILDYGTDGVGRTIELLQDCGLQHVGAGKNRKEARRVLYLSAGKSKLAVINCCEHEFSLSSECAAGANPLDLIDLYRCVSEAKKEADYLLVIVHGGHEYYQLPSPRMKEMYRFLVDIGADAVVNHHQHCFSGYEVYNGKPIFYGLGNFYFGKSEKHTGWNEGYMVLLDFQETGVAYQLYPYRMEERLLLLKEGDQLFSNIASLNRVIAMDDQLQTAWEAYAESKRKSVLNMFSPYASRWTKGLLNRGWLPSFLQKNRLLRISNYVDCESHRDVLSYLLKSQK